jgi:anti-sigma-K factor RskA
MNDHARWADSVGAYLLGALEEGESKDFETHLSECEICRRDVADLKVAADALPVSAPLISPPPALKGRIMAVVNSEAELLAATGRRADEPEPAPRRRWSLGGWITRPGIALACALVLLAGGGLAGALLSGGGESTRTVVAETSAPGADVRLEIRDDGSTLVARHMPAPPAGRIYQVWLLRPGSKNPEPTAALWYPRGDGTAEVAVPGSLDGVDAVLVSAEPPGGSDAPTTAPVINAPTT